ncbi:aminoglycoside phosphotransferase family protein [Sinorhizobium meliloti]|uniref:aminoglycoside phosphotransferase family protein n=1 Tax=Rhizobium meliloti TaxID=382 RepID=UPI002351CAC9|nr:aminoglycoside phosphotransferase family protein [Sinorhizobium meliloti]WQP02574.1 aminoglycoside phosphotransferase family protein [Sinorhizobium meliloti]
MERWRLLRDGELLTTHSSWILPVRQGDMPAMLKVARIPDEEAGYRLLTWWDGQGAARVFASAAGALLMERASGAGDLAQIAWSGQDDEACRILFVRCWVEGEAGRGRSGGRLFSLAPLLRPPWLRRLGCRRGFRSLGLRCGHIGGLGLDVPPGVRAERLVGELDLPRFPHVLPNGDERIAGR